RTTSTRITLTTPIAARAGAAKRGAVSGNTIRNIAAMHLMGIAEQPASSADVARVGLEGMAVPADLAVRAAEVEPGVSENLAAPGVGGGAEEEEEAGDESTARPRYETMRDKATVMNRATSLLVASAILLGTAVVTIAAEPKDNSAQAEQANQEQFAGRKEAAD